MPASGKNRFDDLRAPSMSPFLWYLVLGKSETVNKQYKRCIQQLAEVIGGLRKW
jgi:hypothetical protein